MLNMRLENCLRLHTTSLLKVCLNAEHYLHSLLPVAEICKVEIFLQEDVICAVSYKINAL